MKTIAVLGGAGFIGRHLMKYLEDLGHNAISIDKLGRGADVEIDLTDEIETHRAFALLSLDEVYHLASDVGGVEYMQSEEGNDVLCNDMAVSISVAKAIKACGIKKLLFVSSSSVYPTTRFGRSDTIKEMEAWPANPPSEYGFAKLACERILTKSLASSQCNITIVRLNNTYGPGMVIAGMRESVIAAIIRKTILAETSVEILGTGDQVRTFLYVTDAVVGLVDAMNHPGVKLINLASGDPRTIKQLAWLILPLSKNNLDLTHASGTRGAAYLVPDISLAQRQLGWFPQITMLEGLRKTYANITERMSDTSM